MSRLVWALVLAFVAHLALFLVQMPEQEEAQLTLAGSAHVSVRFAQSSPEPVGKVDAEPEPELVPVVEPEPERVKIVEETVAPPIQQAVAVTGEKKIRDTLEIKEVAEKAIPVVEEQAAVVANTPAADAPEPDGSTNQVIQAIGQAEPLIAVNRPPAYPTLARRRGWQGTVVLEVDVDRGGQVKDVRIQISSSYSLLDREALAAVQKWRFTPGSRNGMAIASKVVVPVHFLLQDN